MIVPDRLLVSTALLENDGVAKLNDILDQGGLGRALVETTPAVSATARLVRLRLKGVDAAAAVDVLRGQLEDPDSVRLDVRSDAATTGGSFTLLGLKAGLGVDTWQPVPEAEMGEAPVWRPVGRQPVVALLDSGVDVHHPWLPDPDHPQPFVTAAEWRPVLDLPALPLKKGKQDFGSHTGHATFIAGLIRKGAPNARLLSLKVMDDLGQIDEDNVVSALEWLFDRVTHGEKIDVVLMAFGRKVVDDDDTTDSAERTKKAIAGLTGNGVQVVMAAGNFGDFDRVFPACYAKEGRALSVGGGLSRDEPNDYTSKGDWVTDWEPGKDTVSLIPEFQPTQWVVGTGFAQWSGTSFSAAKHAAKLAAALG